jgi:Peptidase family M23
MGHVEILTRIKMETAMESIIEILKKLLAAISALLSGRGNYVWPLGNSTTPDEMNTSFGPRINRDKWDFHDGIDLPAPIGTKVYALRDGTVHHAGAGGTGGFSSRHVVLEVNDPNDGLMYLVYVHLDSIDEAVTTGASVSQGQLLGTVGDDDATYPHLHIEFRKGTHLQIDSVHPLGYLPYPNTTNFTPPVRDRFNRLGTLMAARLLFGASTKLEGDLKRVEVDLKSGASLLETRVVDFNEKATVNEGNGDERTYVNDIGVEGYQKSNMVAHGRTDLKYGILVRNIPEECDTLVSRIIDIGGNIASSAEIAVPNQRAIDEYIDFEDSRMPPAGWKVVTSTTGTGTTVANDSSAPYTGSRGMLSTDTSATETNTQRAGIEYALPAGRFEWIAEAWFNPTALELASGQSIYLLHFLKDANLSVAARIQKSGDALRAGIIVKNPDGTLKDSDSAAVIATGVWRRWRLHLLRLATRETTAVLYLNEGEQLVEQARINWDSTIYEPLSLRAGIGLSSAGAVATVLTDELRLTESQVAKQEADKRVRADRRRVKPRPDDKYVRS